MGFMQALIFFLTLVFTLIIQQFIQVEVVNKIQNKDLAQAGVTFQFFLRFLYRFFALLNEAFVLSLLLIFHVVSELTHELFLRGKKLARSLN